jgi:branched-chain amino acid transport system substrate-binding protein
MFRWIVSTALALSVTFPIAVHSEILIGASGALTGPMAWTGEQIARGAEMAVADINSAGGVLGQSVRLITADDFCEPEQAVAAAKKLVSDGVAVVIGHGCSGASLRASQVYEAANVVQISPASTSPVFTEQGRANVFRVIGRDDAQGALAGDYLADRWKDQKIAILHDNTTYGKGLAEETNKQLIKRRVTAAAFQAYEPKKDDYSDEIAALEKSGIAAIYVGGYYTDIALMARTARDRGYSVQFIGGDTMATEEYDLIAGPAAEGTLFTFPTDPRQNAEAKSVVESFRAANFEPDSYTLLSYAAVQAWAQAVAKAGSLDPSDVMGSLHHNSFDTVLGSIAFDGKGDLTVQSWAWYVWRGGEYVAHE